MDEWLAGLEGEQYWLVTSLIEMGKRKLLGARAEGMHLLLWGSIVKEVGCLFQAPKVVVFLKGSLLCRLAF